MFIYFSLFSIIRIFSFTFIDALQLSIPAQGLANGDAALPHAAYPGIQPYPGVGKSTFIVSCYQLCHSMCLASKKEL